jgi:hypothetical protein
MQKAMLKPALLFYLALAMQTACPLHESGPDVQLSAFTRADEAGF